MTTDNTDVAHLLRRAGFGGDAATIANYATLNVEQIVDALLGNDGLPGEPGDVADTNLSDYERWLNLSHWWIDRMATAPVPLIEKTTLFWHGLLTTSFEKVNDADLMWQLHNIQRKNALGSIRAMMQEVSLTPAMLLYLDNAYSRKGAPNENFARELLELFMMGVGNYQESDVEACTRAWTGHNVDEHDGNATPTYINNRNEHDGANKTFFGVTKNWDGPEIIDFLFDDPTQQRVVAKYLCTKLWTFFAYPSPEQYIVDDLSTIMITSGFQMRPVLKALFLKAEFYSTKAKQGLVRSPVEYIVSIHRSSGLRSADTMPMQYLDGLGQELFNPPNVSGWRPNKYWLSAGTAGRKASWAQGLFYRVREGNQPDFWDDLKALSVAEAVATAFRRVGITEPSARSTAVVTDWLTQERAEQYNYLQSLGMTVLVMMLPELQLA
jgi:uncharacterized protein (DUF1800 family)